MPRPYYEQNKTKLKALPVIGSKPGDKAVAANLTTVENGSYSPLSRPVFIYVSEKSLSRPEVDKFVKFYMTQAPELVKAAKYVPLPSKVYALAQERLTNKTTGTVFEGHSDIGLKIEDLFNKESKKSATSKAPAKK